MNVRNTSMYISTNLAFRILALQGSEKNDAWLWADIVFVSIFTVECLLRLKAFGLRTFFVGDNWCAHFDNSDIVVFHLVNSYVLETVPTYYISHDFLHNNWYSLNQ